MPAIRRSAASRSAGEETAATVPPLRSARQRYGAAHAGSKTGWERPGGAGIGHPGIGARLRPGREQDHVDALPRAAGRRRGAAEVGAAALLAAGDDDDAALSRDGREIVRGGLHGAGGVSRPEAEPGRGIEGRRQLAAPALPKTRPTHPWRRIRPRPRPGRASRPAGRPAAGRGKPRARRRKTGLRPRAAGASAGRSATITIPAGSSGERLTRIPAPRGSPPGSGGATGASGGASAG